jgi:hypothetical protein
MISDLLPEVREALEKALSELREKKIPVLVWSDFRTTPTQIILYCQKRAPLEIVNLWRAYFEMRLISKEENETMVAWVDGLHQKSNHQLKKAVDVVPSENGKPKWPGREDPRWKEISDIMKKHGFSWGGDWMPDEKKDFPHYDFVG